MSQHWFALEITLALLRVNNERKHQMGYKDIVAGKYIAKALRGATGDTKNGTPQVGVEFEFTVNGSKETLWWFGFLTPKAREYTYEKLMVIEYNGDRDENGVFPEGSFNNKKEVQIVVEMEEYEGKSRPKIKWINELGGGKFAGMQPSQCDGVDLKKEMKRVYAERGVSSPAAQGNFDEDIAF